MSDKNFRMLDIAVLCVAVIGGLIYVFMGPAGERAELGMKEKDLMMRKAKLTQPGKPLEELKTSTEEGLARVEQALTPLKSLALNITDKYKPEGKENAPNYYKQLVVMLTKKISGGAMGPAFPEEAPLGFTGKMEEKEGVRVLLLRVAAVERLLDVLKAAGSVKVVSIEHLAPRPLAGVEEAYPGAVLLPVKVVLYCTERQGTAFVSALTAPATATILESFRMESAQDRDGLKSEAVLTYLVTDAADILPKSSETGTGPQRTPVRRW